MGDTDAEGGESEIQREKMRFKGRQWGGKEKMGSQENPEVQVA
jgi:hypothetical protein